MNTANNNGMNNSTHQMDRPLPLDGASNSMAGDTSGGTSASNANDAAMSMDSNLLATAQHKQLQQQQHKDDGGDADSSSDSASSSRSSSQEMSGGTKSSGGYSGDYSSISDSSSGASQNGDQNAARGTCCGTTHHKKRRHGKVDGERKVNICGDGTTSGDNNVNEVSAAHVNPSNEANESAPHHHHQQQHDTAVVTKDRYHAVHQHGHRQVEERDEDNSVVRPRHHVHHHHNNHNNIGHHSSPRGNNKANVNRQIDEIMNLYNVSLHAAMKRHDDDGKAVDCSSMNGGAKVAAAASGALDSTVAAGERRPSHLQVESTGAIADGNHHHSHHHHKQEVGANGNSIKPQAPQLGGVRILDPLDPRIDAQKLYQTAASYASQSHPTTTNCGGVKSSDAGTSNTDAVNAKTAEGDLPNGYRLGECYANLLEACRPFFHDSSALMASKKAPMLPVNTNGASDEAQSSSGFTSFFTTTKSESNQTNSGSCGSSSEFSQNHLKVRLEGPEEVQNGQGTEFVTVAHAQTASADAPLVDSSARGKLMECSHPDASVERTQASAAMESDGDDDHSDSSSMVVLARVKRKHKEQQLRQLSNTGTNSSSNSDNTNDRPSTGGVMKHAKKRSSESGVTSTSKRVRIDIEALQAKKSAAKPPLNEKQNAQDVQQQQPQHRESSSLTSSLSTSLDSSGSDGGSGGAAIGQHRENDHAVEQGNSGKEDSQSGTTETNQATTTKTKPHVVTDTSGTTTANNSSGSGTGSGNDNDATNKSESGDQDNSDEQKHSAERESTASDNEPGASSVVMDDDMKIESMQPPMNGTNAAEDKPLIHHHHHGGRKTAVGGSTAAVDEDMNTNDDPQDGAEAMVVTKEDKLIEKKRKRMSARREYEEKVQRQMRDSSESSSRNHDTALEPGKPVTLEEVLSFTKTARYVLNWAELFDILFVVGYAHLTVCTLHVTDYLFKHCLHSWQSTQMLPSRPSPALILIQPLASLYPHSFPYSKLCQTRRVTPLGVTILTIRMQCPRSLAR
jgi:hypothetical protein